MSISINAVFERTIGQGRAKTLLSQSIASAINGGLTLWPLLSQQAGGGKSHFARLYVEALRDQAEFEALFFNSPEEFRGEGEAWESLTNMIKEASLGARRVVIFIDEYHLIHNRPTVRMERLHALLMKAADKGNQGKALPWEGETVVLDRSKICFVLATNFPHQIDKSGAFQSRFDHIALEDYNVEELTGILQIMLQNAGFQPASEKTLSMIAKCGRGTARPMEKIIDRLKMAHNASGKATMTINREDVISALHTSKMYPHGLQSWEVRLLDFCKANPRIDQVIKATMPHVEGKALSKGKGFLIEREFAVQTRSGFQTTTRGVQYLDEIVKAGFPVE